MKWLSAALSYFAIGLMSVLAWLPLPFIRGLGWALALLLFVMLGARRRVARINLSIAFPDRSPKEVAALVRRHFVVFVQAWLDRAWLWHGAPWLTRRRLTITGAFDEINKAGPIVLFVPHFVGLDAAGIAVTQQLPRAMVAIYTNQANPVIDAWVLARRQRFGNIKMLGRVAGVKDIVAALREGGMLALLPDMGFGPEESIFVPFFGIETTTMPSLSRFARLGRARVIPIVTKMTSRGYDIEFKPAWENFPSQDVVADTLRMNETLEGYIREVPEQYFWVHKRYKHRPPGAPSVY
jgi:Kdo2-lipid IVA lauroyltransferase/acyltransferase